MKVAGQSKNSTTSRSHSDHKTKNVVCLNPSHAAVGFSNFQSEGRVPAPVLHKLSLCHEVEQETGVIRHTRTLSWGSEQNPCRDGQ